MKNVRTKCIVLVFIYLSVFLFNNFNVNIYPNVFLETKKVTASELNTDTTTNSVSILNKIATGTAHSAIIKPDGSVWVWGSNWYGQLSLGKTDVDSCNKPIKVQGLSNAISVSAGDQSVVVLKSDGTVVDWGGSYSKGGQVELTNVVSIAAGGNHSLALKRDGTVWAWGHNDEGILGNGTLKNSIEKPVRVKNLTNIIAIAAGYSHSLALRSDGTVWAWGYNYGKLGDGTTENRATPVQVKNLDNVKDISCGSSSSMALKNDGTVWAWGSGLIGDGKTNGDRLIPVQLETLKSIKKISSSEQASCAMDENNNIWMWGLNYYGLFGDGTKDSKSVPTKIPNLNNIIEIKCGVSSTIALHDDGTIWTCGSNNWGNLGNGTNAEEALLPVKALIDCTSPNVLVSSPKNSEIAVSIYKKITVKFNEDIIPGSVYKSITLRDLKNNNIATTRSINGNILTIYPSSILSHNTTYVVKIPYDSIRDKADNPLLNNYSISYTTGRNSLSNECVKRTLPANGEINNKINTSVSITFLVDIMKSVNYNSIRLTEANGNLVPANINISHKVLLVTPKQPLKFNQKYNLLIPSRAIKDNASNTLQGNYNMSFSTMSKDYIVGNSSGCGQSIAVTADGRLFAWGNNSYGQVGNGQIDKYDIGVKKPVQIKGLSNIIAASAGKSFSLALKNDGTAWAWGSNYSGKLGTSAVSDDKNHPVPAKVLQLTNAVAISAGGNHSMALKKDGTVWTWGSNYSGQLGYGNDNWSKVPKQVKGLTGVIAISAGQRHSMALKKDGTVWIWGYNDFGSLGNGNMDNQYAPVKVIGLKDIISISAGNDTSIALKKDGTVISWDGYTDALSTGGKNLKDIIAVSAGSLHNLALKKDGTVWIWGNDDSYSSKSVAVQVPYIENIKNIDAGDHSFLATSGSADMWAWGINCWGALGDGTNIDKDTPVKCLFGTKYSLLNSIIPVNTSTNVSINSDVNIIFNDSVTWNERLLLGIVFKDAKGNIVKGRTRIDLNTFSFIPLEKLKYNTTYTLNIPGSTFQYINGPIYKDAIKYSFTTEVLKK
jgi:alpha-tubulin suppressor-like RCC1 family protein